MLQLNHKRHSSGDYVSVLGLVCYLQTNFFLRFPRYNNQNTSSRVSNPTTGANKNIYSYGNYYTWAAAIANIGDENSGNTSICPNGWRLPNGGNKTNENTNDYWNLVVVHLNSGTRPANYESEVEPYYDDSTEAATVNRRIRSYPNNFVLSGRIYESNIDMRYTRGYYWANTPSDSVSKSYGFSFYDGGHVYPGTHTYSTWSGRPIRCVSSL